MKSHHTSVDCCLLSPCQHYPHPYSNPDLRHKPNYPCLFSRGCALLKMCIQRPFIQCLFVYIYIWHLSYKIYIFKSAYAAWVLRGEILSFCLLMQIWHFTWVAVKDESHNCLWLLTDISIWKTNGSGHICRNRPLFWSIIDSVSKNKLEFYCNNP